MYLLDHSRRGRRWDQVVGGPHDLKRRSKSGKVKEKHGTKTKGPSMKTGFRWDNSRNIQKHQVYWCSLVSFNQKLNETNNLINNEANIYRERSGLLSENGMASALPKQNNPSMSTIPSNPKLQPQSLQLSLVVYCCNIYIVLLISYDCSPPKKKLQSCNFKQQLGITRQISSSRRQSLKTCVAFRFWFTSKFTVPISYVTCSVPEVPFPWKNSRRILRTFDDLRRDNGSLAVNGSDGTSTGNHGSVDPPWGFIGIYDICFHGSL